ncbi:MAG: glycosyltransferase [Proteobacteria bacterium]|nr:glycosyltransferase [Pseudomonadota bacterium]
MTKGTSQPLVSCIMPTYNRRRFVPLAIRYFLAQDYRYKELLILDDGDDSVDDLVPDHPQIRYTREPKGRTLGAKRNRLCELARGDIIAHWDDDDWYAPYRLSYQVSKLLAGNAQVCGINHILFYAPEANRAWEYVYPQGQRFWLSGSSLCYRRAYWESHPFPNMAVGEDARFVWSGDPRKMVTLEDYNFHVGIIHGQNASPKHPRGSRWRPYEVGQVVELFGADAKYYAGKIGSAATESASLHPRLALVAAAYGIGDVLRMTPLVRALKSLGYSVDFLAAPDSSETTSLINNAPEIRKVFYFPDLRTTKGKKPVPQVDAKHYDVAIFSHWAAPLKRWVRARRIFEFSRTDWLRDGDYASAKRIAEQLGWQGSLPAAFALHSGREFRLPSGTVALHPGCKPDWPWKKWHGFEALAARLPEVVIIGTEADLDNSGTYFKKPFNWPAHAHNYIGQLSLTDTAALISQCAALISNDSGMMQLGAGLGIPTFGIFGITSPRREIIPQANVHPITKGLSCESTCHAGSWGRRDCIHRLKCLKTLTVDEVLDEVGSVSASGYSASDTKKEGAMDQISMTYYGYLFDASGYGQAARAYVHALHATGVKLRVVDLANRPRQVSDELIESLVGEPVHSDFYLFHGIPSEWARLAFPCRNTIGVTVWETDTMPSQWRNALNHTLDVWVPCEFNAQTFSRALETPVFRLPHPIPNNHRKGRGYVPNVNEWLGIRDTDFVFYSIIEWQDRKNPSGLIEAFLRTFDDPSGPILIIKSNPGAADAGQHALKHARQRLSSRARIEIRCEAWSDDQIQAVHARGNCYVSLHSGEGWCYPLFEAASRGTPVIATKYSGPLDYLGKDYPGLVDYKLTRVRQPYVYYNGTMQWAAPNIENAVARLRWVYENQEEAKICAERTAEEIQKNYTLEAVGKAAKQRLVQLLCRTQTRRGERLRQAERINLHPTVPIPADWYDADYFEHGLKCNWENGYQWKTFAGLFRDTAMFLVDVFFEAKSFLDVGCAKGFLVRGLRELGKDCWGIDHSRWAIEHAEEPAKPYLIEDSIDKIKLERQFDVLVAFHILQSLTEQQAHVFLKKAREWTRQAIFAVVTTVDNAKEEEHLLHNDNDLSRVTLRSMQWWHEQFLKAGWRQDALHKIVQRYCQNHKLPQKMQWKVFLYSPG